MSLFKEWEAKLGERRENGAAESFFNKYLKVETEAYKKILESGVTEIEGKLNELAEAYQMDQVTFMGFLDGIRSSLDNDISLDALDESCDIRLSINIEKLYYNMLGAKANWLYDLHEWDGRLSLDKRAEIKKQFYEDHRAVSIKVGRNDPCPCGSGKKYKKCCGV